MLKKFTFEVIIYGAGDLLLRMTTIILLPIYTRVLTTAEYGLWNTITVSMGVFMLVVALGGDSAYARLFFSFRSDDEKATLTSTWIGFLAAWSFAVVIAAAALSPTVAQIVVNDPSSAILIVVALFTLPASLINAVCAQAIRNQFLATSFVRLNVVATLLLIGCNIAGVVVLQGGTLGILGGTLIATWLMFPVRLWSVRKLLKPRFSLSLLKQMLGYGLPLVPAAFASWVFVSSDRLLLTQFTSLEIVGYYAVASQITGLVGMVYNALSQAFSPRFTHLYETQPDDTPRIVGGMLVYILVLFGCLAVGVTVFAPELIAILAAPDYAPAAAAVAPLSLGFVAYATTQITAIGISLKNRTIYFAIVGWMAALTNLILNLILIPQYGFMAAAWTTAAAYLVLTLGYHVASHRLYPLQYRYGAIVGSVFLTIAAVIAASIWLHGDSVGLVMKVAYCALYAGATLITGIIPFAHVRTLYGVFREQAARLLPANTIK